MFMPSFEETRFICKKCGKRFSGKDCNKDTPAAIFTQLFPIFQEAPKCPNCGSHKTEKDPAVVY